MTYRHDTCTRSHIHTLGASHARRPSPGTSRPALQAKPINTARRRPVGRLPRRNSTTYRITPYGVGRKPLSLALPGPGWADGAGPFRPHLTFPQPQPARVRRLGRRLSQGGNGNGNGKRHVSVPVGYALRALAFPPRVPRAIGLARLVPVVSSRSGPLPRGTHAGTRGLTSDWVASEIGSGHWPAEPLPCRAVPWFDYRWPLGQWTVDAGGGTGWLRGARSERWDCLRRWMPGPRSEERRVGKECRN